MYYIYAITNKLNNKVYIGYTSKSPEHRFNAHIKASNTSRYSHLKLYRAFKKHGIESFVLSTIETFDKLEDCLLKEDYYISYYKSKEDEYGYNMCPGGQGGHIKSKEQLRVLSIEFTNNNPILKIKEDPIKYELWKNNVSIGNLKAKQRYRDNLLSTFLVKLESNYPKNYPISIKNYIIDCYKESLFKRYLRYNPRYRNFYITPKGIFTSITIAAKYIKLHHTTILNYCKNKKDNKYDYFKLDINLIKPLPIFIFSDLDYKLPLILT